MKGRLREIGRIDVGAGVLLFRCRCQISRHCPGQKRRRKDELGLNYSATHRNLRSKSQQVYSLSLICLSFISLSDLRLSDPPYTLCGLEPLVPENTMGTAKTMERFPLCQKYFKSVKSVCDCVYDYCFTLNFMAMTIAVQTGMICDYTKGRYKCNTAVSPV